MALTVKWNKRAETSFKKIVEYLGVSFGELSAKSFILRTFSIIDTLSEYPEIGTKESNERYIRGFVITKHNTIFYRYTDSELVLLNFFDNRKNPKKRTIPK